MSLETMKYSIIGFEIENIDMCGSDLNITISTPTGIGGKLIELKGVVGFIDHSSNTKNLAVIRLDQGGSSYAFSLSCRFALFLRVAPS